MAEKVLSLSEIDAEIERLNSMRTAAEWREHQAAMVRNHSEAVEVTDRLVADIRKLEELGYLPPKLKAALTDQNDKFNPGMYIKRPKAPRG
jgi:predicted  nucleic acid-binding Zn-ribbon protein